MKAKPRSSEVMDFEKEIFNVLNKPLKKGAWLWWFWLFYIKTPKSKKPRQLMILWSSKNNPIVECNGVTVTCRQPINKSKFDGTVAAWYFDGKKMHHNFIMEQCNLRVSDTKISSDTKIPTSYQVNKTSNIIKIGNDFKFIAKRKGDHSFLKPIKSHIEYLGKGYSIIRVNKMDLTGTIKNEKITGTAYLQRVYVNSPTVPWYWGLFHFDNGGVILYFNPRIAGKSIKKQLYFFDSKKLYKFKKMKVKRIEGKLPIFEVSGESNQEKISFKVNPYSHSSWTLKRKVLGFLPSNMNYNEYPSTISDLSLTDRKSGKNILIKGLGSNVGNAEHTTGVLL